MTGRIYLDNAATSWPKSQPVIEAVTQFITLCGATAGRGCYRSAAEAERWLSEARLQLARLIGARDFSSIAFCSSGTHALNAALHGVIREGDHVISTDIEHNSVLRPLAQLVRLRGVELDVAASDIRGVASIVHAQDLIRPETRWLVIGHASNVTGAVQDLNAWSQLARQHGVGLIVDASQTLGYLPIDVVDSSISVLASAGHKGLGGIAGTGFVYSTKELRSQFQPVMTGGTGLNSESIESASTWPQVIEVGNHNLPGIVSMAVAARELNLLTDSVRLAFESNWRKLFDLLVSGLRKIPKIELLGFGPINYEGSVGTDVTEEALPHTTNPTQIRDSSLDRVPLVSMRVADWDVHELASVLDSSFGIEVRAGLHCAAKIHTAIGSKTSGGTLRLSLGHSSSERDVFAVLDALKSIVKN